MTSEGLALIKRFEGLRLKQYRCAAGVSTIGWGTTRWTDGGPIPEGLMITREEAERLIARDVAVFELKVYRLVTGLAPESHSALVSFAYNCGTAALAGSTLLRRVRAGRMEEAAAQFGKWVSAGGRRLEGLVIRRAAERRMFLEGVHRLEDLDLAA